MTKLQPEANLSGLDISAGIEAEPDGVNSLDPELAAIWILAAPYLLVRDNDAHTLYAVGLARALLEAHPEADAAVVLPAIMLHDIGWSQVPPGEVLEAIAPGGGRPDLVLLHEKEGARPAAGILAAVGCDVGKVPAIWTSSTAMTPAARRSPSRTRSSRTRTRPGGSARTASTR